jgi:hypothetical protein
MSETKNYIKYDQNLVLAAVNIYLIIELHFTLQNREFYNRLSRDFLKKRKVQLY